MKLLAADTATSSCSVAIAENNVIRVEFTVNLTRTHARSLMPVIDDALQAAGQTLLEMDAFAVTIGPGSFTGLRIGISTLKGLAAATGKPIVGISTLDVLAFQFAGASMLICPLIDARKGEVYSGRYRFKNGRFSVDMVPDVMPPGQVIEGIDEACIFVGNGAMLYADLIRKQMGALAFFAQWDQHVIHAGTVARIARQKLMDNPSGEGGYVVPQYIRPSDAECNLSKKS